MTKEKQIEEMALDICTLDLCMHLAKEDCDETTCDHCTAEALYNAGYRKQSEGEWIEKPRPYEDEIECSVCGANFNMIDNCTEKFDFCPNCGAKMKGDADNEQRKAD